MNLNTQKGIYKIFELTHIIDPMLTQENKTKSRGDLSNPYISGCRHYTS